MKPSVPESTLHEMIGYYRARASEYDEWFYRQGRFDRGSANNKHWFQEVQQVSKALDDYRVAGRVLELACGTGIWTERLLRTADSITAVDASPEVLEINRGRVKSDRVTYIEADLFRWQPPMQYDAVFFAFWLSHVPAERLKPFWDLVASALAPEGRVFLIDSQREPTGMAYDQVAPESGQMLTRRLNDGRSFEIVKNFYDPGEVASTAIESGIELQVRQTDLYFLWGTGKRRS
jgi:2-polyprenyl-3-methyl-5-hydroxy-6-metoxy-1,4-benzoquinol methylase